MWYYFSQDNIQKSDRINLGKWVGQVKELNRRYDNFINRLTEFFLRTERDPYQRFFLAEPIIDFAIARGIADCSVEYIYKHYVYNKLSEYEYLDIERAYLDDLFNDFVLIEKDEQTHIV